MFLGLCIGIAEEKGDMIETAAIRFAKQDCNRPLYSQILCLYSAGDFHSTVRANYTEILFDM